MFNKAPLTALMAVLFLAATLQASAARYAVSSFSENTVRIAVTVAKTPRELALGQAEFFAFSTKPNTPFSATLRMRGAAGEVALPVQTAAPGWSGGRFLQWVSFDPRAAFRGAQAATTLTGTLDITYAAPVLRGAAAGSVRVAGDVLLADLPAPALARSATPAAAPFRYGLRVEVAADGIYELSYEGLKAARVPVASIPSYRYRLWNRDREVPLSIAAAPKTALQPGDRIFFYGEMLHGNGAWFTQFSNSNMYWLSWSDSTPGIRTAEVSGEQRTSELLFSQDSLELRAHDFYDTIHLEQDNDIRWLGNVSVPGEMTEGPASDSAIDNWYWGFVGESELTTYTVSLPAPAKTGYARLRVAFMGLTSSAADPADHQVTVEVNGNPAGANATAVWDGQTPFVFESDTFSVARLKEGSNDISFIVKSRATPDRSALNWIEVIYPRTYRALDGQCAFKSSDNAVGKTVQFEVAGFASPSIEVWDILKNRRFSGLQIKRGSGNDRSLYTLVFQDSVPTATRYLAQTVARRLVPASAELDTLPTSWESVAGADYVIIGAGWGRDAVAPLMNAHQREGMRTAFVDIKNIYNSFSWGIRDPECIRSFMTMLFALSPGHPPRYLLLAGDCTHDLDKKNQDRTVVPTHLTRVPGWGPASDDDYFVTVQGDDRFADLAVGRMPAENSSQLAIMVDKTVKYMTTPSRGFWRDNLVLASGQEPDFTDFTNTLAGESVGPRMNILRMDADPQSPYYKDELTAAGAMAAFINAGVFAINFNGHGGGNIWSDSRFFGYNDLDKLQNGQWGAGGRLPVIFSLTCLTGFFESVFYRSLGEEFVRTSGNGAVCFYGASAYTSKKGNLYLDRILMDNALNTPSSAVGDIILQAETEMLVRYGPTYLPLTQQYNLLGDPALPWLLTPDTLRCTLGKSALVAADSLKISGTCDPVKNGSLSLLVEAGGALWNRSIDPVGQGAFSKAFRIKDSVKTASGMVRAYAWNDSIEVRGWSLFSKDTIAVTDLRVSPVDFAYGDSVAVSCGLALQPGARTSLVYCLYAVAPPSMTGTSFTGVPMTQDSGGRWSTAKKLPVTFTGDINAMFLVYFRVLADSFSKETSLQTFPVRGRPDLTFAGATPRVRWERDSLRLPLQVINAGNAASPPFSVALFWGAGPATDTVGNVLRTDSLLPGTSWDCEIALPDTNGVLPFTAVINPSHRFEEVLFGNNQATGTLRVVSRILAGLADTLRSRGGGLVLTAAAALSAPYKAFLFDEPAPAEPPLLTESRWLPLAGDSAVLFGLGTRPHLAAGDSLLWTFRAESLPSGFTSNAVQTAAGKVVVMLRDSSLGAWRYAGGRRNAAFDLVFASTGSGPFAPAFLADVRPPDIQVSVYGRDLTFLDYAAKNKPFNILLADPSGISPASVTVRLNNRPLAKTQASEMPKNNDLRNLTVTTYPPAEKAVDSLAITVCDLAGNQVTQQFAYMPGENLDIKFLSCHPNPFSLRARGVNGPPQLVRFAFLLTDNAADATLAVYTVTGKRIWSQRMSNIIGYQEAVWDGRDGDGYRIANGTYYAKLTAKNSQKSVNKTIRIAKLEGY